MDGTIVNINYDYGCFGNEFVNNWPFDLIL